MLPIPAIDIKGGKCVRLKKGDYEQENDIWRRSGGDGMSLGRNKGAEYLHLVDLDGAKEGTPVHTEIIQQIVQQAGVPCQLGGGIRDRNAIENALQLGIERVIIGTQAIKDTPWFLQTIEAFPNRLVLGLDARYGRLATEGWLDQSEIDIVDFSIQFNDLPLAAVIYTDIERDGMLTGPDYDGLSELKPEMQSSGHCIRRHIGNRESFRLKRSWNSSLYSGQKHL